MLIRRLKEDAIEFIQIEPIEAGLLQEVPGVCDSGGDDQSDARLYSSPADSSENQFLNDWAEYVRPELRHLFLSARKTVKEDLEKLSDVPGRLRRLVIPRAHSDAWLNVLNQARLILAARFNFTARELSTHSAPKWFSRRELVLQQINFYAEIQERIIDATEE
ncbi:MAG: hypothetical protein JOZ60_00840 [Verrucomicrobia bacterium]|nr:hypothetical protein [Verrucomicrobiota bacterium]